ncbi:hypothetical protein CDD81_2601 [Ophiocordyceps australis]|uniref:Uncharacterized protein n=1 Tax=Ophiocordyceps australis TaxID=1399860 RepID=A0A2C5XWJ7_9HYPO|nr:hypothetical protein CDD81_2601 [Ophiocordyceps australis]
MPPGRPRSRLTSNDHDENSTSTRMTRAKAAALNADELSLPSKPAVQSRKTVNSGNVAPQRKRTALGDVSNFGKNEGEAKKGLISKTAYPTGVQKNTSRPAGRTALASKDINKAETVQRSGSGAGTLAAGPKRKASSTLSAVIKEDSSLEEEAEPVRKRVHTSLAAKHIREEAPVEDAANVVAAVDRGQAPPPEVQGPLREQERPQNLDKEDRHDQFLVAEYVTDIFEYLRKLEVKTIPNPDYMIHQDDLEWKTRAILIDWLIEVHTRFHLLPETLFLAVNIIDRFLSLKVVQLDRLQLVGITAMFIASKYEEVLSPHVENFKRITDNGFNEAEILSAERFILTTLNYDLSYPSPMNFLRRISKADNYNIQSRTVSKYFMEISLLDHRFMSIRSSLIAAAAICLARLMLSRGEWNVTLAHYAGYAEDEIEPVLELMVDYLVRPVIHEGLFKKYAGKRFLKASIMARQWAKRYHDVFGVKDSNIPLDQVD